MNNYKWKKAQYVELLFQGGSSQSQVNFTPQTYLQGKKTTSLEIVTSTEQTTAFSGNPIATPAQINTCYLTLYSNDPAYPIQQNTDKTWTGSAYSQWFQTIPLWLFHRINNGTDPYVRDLMLLDNLLITWEKSFIFTTDVTLFPNITSFVFNVGYDG